MLKKAKFLVRERYTKARAISSSCITEGIIITGN